MEAKFILSNVIHIKPNLISFKIEFSDVQNKIGPVVMKTDLVDIQYLTPIFNPPKDTHSLFLKVFDIKDNISYLVMYIQNDIINKDGTSFFYFKKESFDSFRSKLKEMLNDVDKGNI